MLLILRFFSFILLSSLVCLLGSLYCLLRPRDPRHVATFGHLFGRLAPLFGLQVICRLPGHYNFTNPAVYIGNHQNNYDMITISCMVPPSAVTIGKKNLIWIPLFGPLYWLTGNILINRQHRTKAFNTLAKVVQTLQKKECSVWMFPEGTRSCGRGLMPFKLGAFHAAIAAGVPIIPICSSNLHRRVQLNRWQNGRIIVEMLPAIVTEGLDKSQARELAERCHHLMQTTINRLDAEIAGFHDSNVGAAVKISQDGSHG
ncbi:MAG: 1-acylglycerol-3-phosphate O-acyltransferase [Candidatus Symbiodolus clandestinus]